MGLKLIDIPGDPNGATILLLHGFGASADDLYSLHEIYQEFPRPRWIFPEGPLEIPLFPGYIGRAWFPIDMEALEQGDLQKAEKAFPQDLKEARQHLERLIGELNIPRSKLLIGGFSQGAVLAIDTVLHGHERVGGLLIFSGTLICETEWSQLVPLHAKTPFFQSHGIRDNLLSLKKAEELTALLQKGGLEGNLHIFQGGHEIPPTILTKFKHFLSNIL